MQHRRAILAAFFALLLFPLQAFGIRPKQEERPLRRLFRGRIRALLGRNYSRVIFIFRYLGDQTPHIIATQPDTPEGNYEGYWFCSLIDAEDNVEGIIVYTKEGYYFRLPDLAPPPEAEDGSYTSLHVNG